jgi:hypothetical protein
VVNSKLFVTYYCYISYVLQSFEKFLNYLDKTMLSLLWIVNPFVNISIDTIDWSSLENFPMNRNKNILYKFDVVQICILLPLIKVRDVNETRVHILYMSRLRNA